MSKRFKFNVLLSGYQNFNDVFAAQGSRIYNGFSRLVIPKPLPMPRPDCKYYQQDYVKRTTRDLVRLVLSEPLKNATLTHKISHGPLTANWLTTLRAYLIVSQGFCLSWRSSFDFYYEVKKPTCPPPPPKIGKDCEPKEKPPICPEPKCGDDPCGKKWKPNPCESNPCSRKCTFTLPMKLCRFYCKGCPSRSGGGGGKPKCGGGGGSPKKPTCGSKKSSGGGTCGRKKSSGGGTCGRKKKPAGGTCGGRKGGGGSCGSRGSVKRSCGKGGGKKSIYARRQKMTRGCPGKTKPGSGGRCGGGAGKGKPRKPRCGK
ncbi:uncharacterized protein LOC118266502 isoform X3 [Spodoptera frugiperda]|uniref:Uncharacterized protein LOC118266502 isoform X3 n=1 Tax=Spodoptera frugiperda TaxID=7108 RepID=A0A9R0DPM2_SPOFR|nr:uncharacterized protein LOC118266502 isoform X3 [Spodoptera frugiperda]